MDDRHAATLSLPPAAENVRTARLVAVAAARRAGLDEEVVDDVRLAVGELVARAVLRHERAGVDDDVELRLVDAGDCFEIVVTDRAGDDGHLDQDGSGEDEVALALVRALAPEAGLTPATAVLRWPIP